MIVERAATQHTFLSSRRPLRVNDFTLRILSVPVVTPLRYVAVHIVQAPGIWREPTDWSGLFSTLSLRSLGEPVVPVIIHLIGRDGVSEIERRCRSCPASVFPLSLSW